MPDEIVTPAILTDADGKKLIIGIPENLAEFQNFSLVREFLSHCWFNDHITLKGKEIILRDAAGDLLHACELVHRTYWEARNDPENAAAQMYMTIAVVESAINKAKGKTD